MLASLVVAFYWGRDESRDAAMRCDVRGERVGKRMYSILYSRHSLAEGMRGGMGLDENYVWVDTKNILFGLKWEIIIIKCENLHLFSMFNTNIRSSNIDLFK